VPAGVTAVLFDLDDTLYDRELAQREIARMLFREFRGTFVALDEGTVIDAFLRSDRTATREFLAGGPPETVRSGRSKQFLASLGVGGAAAGEVTHAYVNAYGTLDVPVAGAKRVVEQLSGRLELGIISNGFPDVQYAKLRSLNIDHLFRCVLLSEEVGIRKPDPAVFLRAATYLSRDPAECLFVGDSYENDVVGAKGAGMAACWYNPSDLRLPRTDVKPDCVIKRLSELPELVDPSEVSSLHSSPTVVAKRRRGR
jgi:HAD superfamily hydrolase (TIGR01549 family)